MKPDNVSHFRVPIAPRIEKLIFLDLCCFHPDCGCAANIYHHPFDEDAPEVNFTSCEKDGPIHDQEVLQLAALEQWRAIVSCAQRFVLGHESHPEWENEETVH